MASKIAEKMKFLAEFTLFQSVSSILICSIILSSQICESVHPHYQKQPPLPHDVSLKSRLLIATRNPSGPLIPNKGPPPSDTRIRMDNDGESENEEDTEDKLILITTARPQPLIINSHPILTSSSLNKPPLSPPGGSTNKPYNSKKQPLSGTSLRPITTTAEPKGTTTSHKFVSFGNLPPESQSDYQMGQGQNLLTKTQLDDLFPSKIGSFPYPTAIPSLPGGGDSFVQSFQSIKDAYFEVLEKMRDFRNGVSKRFEMLERQLQEAQNMLNRTISKPVPIPQPISPYQDQKLPEMHVKMVEMERRFNISRLVDHCVHYILANSLTEAHKLWTTLEMLTAPNLDETNDNLREIVHLSYTRNSSNTSPVFPFLRRLNGVEKLPLYDFLINGMKSRDDFDGSEIFYIAQFLKERNAVRSAIYSKIPKAVQYAVSGRNVNIVFVDKRSGRNYVHVRDDQNRRDRLNFYIQASQSYTDTRAAVWNVDFESSSETFRIRNSLYGDYMYVNEEGFLETLPANTAAHMGTEFNFILKKNNVMIQSKNYKNHPLVVIRGGGKFPFYFSLLRENPHAPIAEFLVEPDTLL